MIQQLTENNHAKGESISPFVDLRILRLAGILFICWTAHALCIFLPSFTFTFQRTGFIDFRSVVDLLAISILLTAGISLLYNRIVKTLLMGNIIIAGIMSILMLWVLSESILRIKGLSLNSSILMLQLMTAFNTIGSFSALFLISKLVMFIPDNPLRLITGVIFCRQISVVMALIINVGTFSQMLSLGNIPLISMSMKLAEIIIPILFIAGLLIWRFSQKYFVIILYAIIILSVLVTVLWSFTQVPLIDHNNAARFILVICMALISLIEGTTLIQMVYWSLEQLKNRQV